MPIRGYYFGIDLWFHLCCFHVPVESVDDRVGQRDVWYHDLVTSEVLAHVEEDAGGRDDDISTVVLEVKRNHALLDAHRLEHGVETLQFSDGEFFVFTFLADLEQFVDVATGTDDVDVGVELGIALQICLHRFPGFGCDAVREQAQRTYIIGVALGEGAVVDERDLRAATAHVDVGKVALIGVGLLHKVVDEQQCLVGPLTTSRSRPLSFLIVLITFMPFSASRMADVAQAR